MFESAAFTSCLCDRSSKALIIFYKPIFGSKPIILAISELRLVLQDVWNFEYRELLLAINIPVYSKCALNMFRGDIFLEK